MKCNELSYKLYSIEYVTAYNFSVFWKKNILLFIKYKTGM